MSNNNNITPISLVRQTYADVYGVRIIRHLDTCYVILDHLCYQYMPMSYYKQQFETVILHSIYQAHYQYETGHI